jgi:hypothetical protein
VRHAGNYRRGEEERGRRGDKEMEDGAFSDLLFSLSPLLLFSSSDTGGEW